MKCREIVKHDKWLFLAEITFIWAPVKSFARFVWKRSPHLFINYSIFGYAAKFIFSKLRRDDFSEFLTTPQNKNSRKWSAIKMNEYNFSFVSSKKIKCEKTHQVHPEKGISGIICLTEFGLNLMCCYVVWSSSETPSPFIYFSLLAIPAHCYSK